MTEERRQPPKVINRRAEILDDETPFEKISEIVLYVREVKGDMSKVSRKYKVPITIVNRWKERYGKVLYTAHPMQMPSIEDGIKVKREIETEGLRETAGDLLDITMKKILDRVNDEDIPLPTKDLIAIVKEIFPYILPKFTGKGGNVEATNVENTYNVVMNTIYNKLNGNDNSKAAITGNKA